jgi:hypothetical protein
VAGLGALQAYYLQKKVHYGRAIDVAEHVGNDVGDRFEELDHLVSFLVQKALVDAREIRGLHRVERWVALQVAPEAQHALPVFEQGLGDGPHIGGEDLAGDVGVLCALLLLLALLVEVLDGL